MSIAWNDYDPDKHFDELFAGVGKPRATSEQLIHYFKSLSADELASRKDAAEATIKETGVSFTVYTEEGNIDRAWPFDIIPRTISKQQWQKTSAGLKQRLQALNLFIDDLYHDQRIIKDGIIPEFVHKQSKNYRPECEGMSPAFGVWAHICGTDLVRDKDGEFYVLEDNLRVPSGVSYMLENRSIMKRVLPEVFEKVDIVPVNDYPDQLLKTLSSLSPRQDRSPIIVVLTIRSAK